MSAQSAHSVAFGTHYAAVTALPKAPKGATKKAHILALARAAGSVSSGDIAAISAAADARPSYVAAVLNEAKLLRTYFDLYTATEPMNIYSTLFRGKVGFRDSAVAATSIDLLEQHYAEFAQLGDKAGQHHVLIEALQLFDRARWSGKKAEARLFRTFIVRHLEAGGIGTVLLALWGLSAAVNDFKRTLQSAWARSCADGALHDQ